MAAPLWSLTGDPQVSENRLQFRTPTLLRFATDTFMDDFQNLLKTDPQSLSQYVAAPETWSSPPNEPVPPVAASGLALVLTRARQAAVKKLQAKGTRVIGEIPGITPGKVLKLYQPAHGRFYLVAACLVCRMLGLPDRRIDAGAQERVTFLLRLLQPHSDANPQNPDPRDCDEFALVNGAWQRASEPESFVSGEEQHPLAPTAYAEDDLRRRRLLVGLIPVGDRERLLQARQPNPSGKTPPPPPLVDPRQMLLKNQVIGPMSKLEDLAISGSDLAGKVESVDPQPTQNQRQDIANRINNQIQQVCWYLLLDLAKFLESYIPNVWQIVRNKTATLSSDEQTLWNTFSQTSFAGTTLASALSQAYDASDQLEAATTNYSGDLTGWPSFTFRFYSAAIGQEQTPLLDRGTLETQIVNALAALPPNTPQPSRTVAQANANPQAPVWFTIRCVLERPNCGALTPPLVSEASVAFQLAAFFDPDAPSRPIRIGLPVDTSPAGLRKFDKNTAFVMSDILCGQVTKMGSLTFLDLVLSVLPFPFHAGLPTEDMKPCSGGMVCSLSIPIITICALILLIIFVKLLDIIFFWMPFFQICLPLPNFSAKES